MKQKREHFSQNLKYLELINYLILKSLNSCFCFKGTSYRNYLTIIFVISKISPPAKPGKRKRMICTYPLTKQNVLKNQSNTWELKFRMIYP